MRNTVDILGVPVDNVTMDRAVDRVISFLSEDRVHAVYTPNAEIMMAAQRDSNLKNILMTADLLVADGAGVVLASKILGKNLPERVAGLDMVSRILSLSSGKKIKLFLFGGKPGVEATLS
jgi:N-acetylglucosaminyldiphosphoundecaprenol N-acetyl-beta-D-mannosaminyltransferase